MSNSQFYDCITQGEIEKVKQYLVKQLVNINELNEDGMSPLMLACFNHHVEIAQLLIEQGANLNVKDLANWSALSYAMFVGNAEIAILLIQSGASYDEIEDEEEFLAFKEVKQFIDAIKEKDFLNKYN